MNSGQVSCRKYRTPLSARLWVVPAVAWGVRGVQAPRTEGGGWRGVDALPPSTSVSQGGVGPPGRAWNESVMAADPTDDWGLPPR